MKFEELGLSPELLRAVADAGYIEPTPIQEMAIPIALQGRDLLGCAQTGTGKTAAFTLPMIDILAGGKAKARMPRSLILTPTRELAAQISENFEIYGKQHRLVMALLIGGVSITEQEKVLSRSVDVLIATPGRFLDLFERGKILLTGVKILVIDEADRMLDMGFIPDVERIVALLPALRQTLFFSATMAPEIRRLADAFLHNPKEVSVTPPASPAENVSHALAMVGPRDKGKALRHLLEGDAVTNALIFCNRKRDVDTVNRSLKRYGFHTAALHGDMPQSARTETLANFKQGNLRFLVATDVAGRGLDVFGLSHVFNYDVPTHAEDYVHRIGRTGRAGHRGRAITLAVSDDVKFIAAIERLIGRKIPRVDIAGSTPAIAATATTDHDEVPQPKRGSRVGSRRKQAGAAGAAKAGKRRETTSRAETPKSSEGSRSDAGHKKMARGDGKQAAKTPRTTGERERASERKERAVVGMGDHVPAFMLRPAKPTRK
jgi:superfamily II DNA/RNA helicase